MYQLVELGYIHELFESRRRHGDCVDVDIHGPVQREGLLPLSVGPLASPHKSQVPRPPLAVPRLNHPRTFCAVLRIQSKCQDNQETEPPRHLLPEAQHPKSARRKRTCH